MGKIASGHFLICVLREKGFKYIVNEGSLKKIIMIINRRIRWLNEILCYGYLLYLFQNIDIFD